MFALASEGRNNKSRKEKIMSKDQSSRKNSKKKPLKTQKEKKQAKKDKKNKITIAEVLK
jgi:hypothetical protein